MLEVSDAARKRLAGIRFKWVPLERTGRDAGSLPAPERVVPPRDPDALTDDAIVQAYRSMFWDLDIDPTKQRPAGEALARRVADGEGLPSILPLVDAYNLASAETLVPVSAFALDAVEGSLTVDVAGDDESFDPIGGEPTELDAGRPVVRDEAGIVSLLAYRDAQRTALSDATDEALCLVCGPTEAGPRILPEVFRKLETYASIVGWRFSRMPESLEL